MTDAVERLVNLALFFADARGPVTAERVRTEVFGYPEGQDDAAFYRMFERDKEDLKKMGLSLEANAEGNYRLDRAASFASAVELTPAEASAVRVAGLALLGDPSFPFGADLRLALAKVSAEVECESVRAVTRLADEDPAAQGRAVALLTATTTARKRVSFGYTNSLGASALHEVEPYGLFLHDGRWYLVGRDIGKDQVRTYTVARMTAIAPNAEKPKHADYERPAGFDVARYVRLPFQYGPEADEFTATLRFAPDVAWRARSLAAGQGELETAESGSVTWRVAARSARRLARFAIEHGPGIEVAGPPELLGEVGAGLAKVVALHG